MTVAQRTVGPDDSVTAVRARLQAMSDREHHAMIDRIEAGEPAGAEATMRVHLQTMERNMRRILGPDASATTGELP